MKKMSAKTLTFSVLLLAFGCSKTATESLQPASPDLGMEESPNVGMPETEPTDCISELRPNYEPPEFYHDGQQLCPNPLQYQFFGNFGIDSSGNWFSEINCVQNPRNWTFSFFESGEYKAIQMMVDYSPTIPRSNEPNIYLSATNFRLRQNSTECKEFGYFDYVSGAEEGNRRNWLLIFLKPGWWECDPQEFDFEFHTLGTFDFPIEG